MPSATPKSWALLISTLTLLFTQCRAQSSNGINLTVTFSENGSGSCADTSTGQGITFSTAMIPYYSVCFNLDELITENNNTGIVQQSEILQNRPTNFSWSASGNENYNLLAKYSQVWYQQTNITGKIGAGQDAARQLSVYSGRDCHSINGSELRTLEPWIGWTCQSEAGGQCDTVPISIKSFLIADASLINNGYPKCWDDAVMGGASRARFASVWTVGVVVVAAVLLL
ncbi:hypothetical protein VTO58DRAFT_103460 [Aureobasidium pullulans]|nr:hypothetical protein JADG_010615 [Aureobasidium pullulans]